MIKLDVAFPSGLSRLAPPNIESIRRRLGYLYAEALLLKDAKRRMNGSLPPAAGATLELGAQQPGARPTAVLGELAQVWPAVPAAGRISYHSCTSL